MPINLKLSYMHFLPQNEPGAPLGISITRNTWITGMSRLIHLLVDNKCSIRKLYFKISLLLKNKYEKYFNLRKTAPSGEDFAQPFNIKPWLYAPAKTASGRFWRKPVKQATNHPKTRQKRAGSVYGMRSMHASA